MEMMIQALCHKRLGDGAELAQEGMGKTPRSTTASKQLPLTRRIWPIAAACIARTPSARSG